MWFGLNKVLRFVWWKLSATIFQRKGAIRLSDLALLGRRHQNKGVTGKAIDLGTAKMIR
jgi:hypothetical protein